MRYTHVLEVVWKLFNLSIELLRFINDTLPLLCPGG